MYIKEITTIEFSVDDIDTNLYSEINRSLTFEVTLLMMNEIFRNVTFEHVENIYTEIVNVLSISINKLS